MITRFIISIFSVGLMVPGAGGLYGQEYPNKPIRIVTSGVGGGNDVMSRLLAQALPGNLGQPIIVDNRPSGVIPGDIVSKASPDGHTLLVAGNPLWIGPLLQKSPYDPVRDFSPITLMASSPITVVVHPSVPAKSVKELIALAKARPGDLNYASVGTGGTAHLAGELFKYMARVNIVRINYKETGASLNALISGQLQVGFPSSTSVSPHVKSGRLRALAVGSAEPSALAPGLPTLAASGVPRYESGSYYSLFAPAKTPAAVIIRLNQEVVRFLHTAEAKERVLSLGAEVVGSSPETLADKIKSDVTTWGKIIKDTGITAD